MIASITRRLLAASAVATSVLIAGPALAGGSIIYMESDGYGHLVEVEAYDAEISIYQEGVRQTNRTTSWGGRIATFQEGSYGTTDIYNSGNNDIGVVARNSDVRVDSFGRNQGAAVYANRSNVEVRMEGFGSTAVINAN